MTVRGAVIAVTLQPADQGDTTTIQNTLLEAGETVVLLAARELEQAPEEKPQVNANGIEEVVGAKGYHSGRVVLALASVPVRSYIAEPKRGPRRWDGKTAAQKARIGNRRRVQGNYGKRRNASAGRGAAKKRSVWR
jgi:transposase